jgi:hypothetical protein
VLVLALALAGCGNEEPSAEERRVAVVDQLAEDLRTEVTTLTAGQADCVAEALVDTVGEERFDDLIGAAAGDGDPALRDQVVDVFASCDALDRVQGGG